MGDQAEYGHALQQARKERHADWKRKNMAVMNASEFFFLTANHGEVLLFGRAGGLTPLADFYPSTGRWRVSGVGRTFSGGAEKFLTWYRAEIEKRKAGTR